MIRNVIAIKTMRERFSSSWTNGSMDDFAVFPLAFHKHQMLGKVSNVMSAAVKLWDWKMAVWMATVQNCTCLWGCSRPPRKSK